MSPPVFPQYSRLWQLYAQRMALAKNCILQSLANASKKF